MEWKKIILLFITLPILLSVVKAEDVVKARLVYTIPENTCKPVCSAIGTASEGWYDSCTHILIKLAKCAGHDAILMEGDQGYGWYDSVNGELILPININQNMLNTSNTTCKTCNHKNENIRILCKETSIPYVYRCLYGGEIYTCSSNKTFLESCRNVVISKVLQYNNKTLYCLPFGCKIDVTPAGKCFVDCLVSTLGEEGRRGQVQPGIPEEISKEWPPERNQRFLECIREIRNWAGELTDREARAMCGYLAGPRLNKTIPISPFLKCLVEKYKENVTFEEAIDECKVMCPQIVPPTGRCPNGTLIPIVRFGCVVGYRCLPIQELFARCIVNKTREGINRTEAIKICSEEYKEQIINILSNMSEAQLAYHLKCLNVPEQTRKQLENLINELRNLRKEKIEKIREISKECYRLQKGNETTVQVGEKCGQELQNITLEYNEKIKEIMKEILNIVRNVNMSVNVTCLKEKISILNELTGISINLSQINRSINLTPYQKEKLIEKIFRERFMRIIRKNPKIAPEIIKELVKRKEFKPIIINELGKNKTILKEALHDPEIRKEIINEIRKNPRNHLLLRNLLKIKEVRGTILRTIVKNKTLKKEFLQNKTLLSEILPPKLKKMLYKLQFQDINLTEVGNHTIIKARVKRFGRLFGIIPITLNEEIEFNDTTIIKERKPWWSFLVFS